MLYDTTTVPPPGVWRWRVPETQTLLEAETFGELVTKSSSHYAANGFSYGTALERRVNQGVCEYLISAGVKGFCPDPPLPVSEFIELVSEPKGSRISGVTHLKKLLR